jgi:outer membrane immunogenic protein
MLRFDTNLRLGGVEMKVKSILLASVAGSAVAPMANAADLPAKAGPQVAPIVAAVPSWAGFYMGVNAGVAWQKARASNYYGINPTKVVDSDAGFIGGGQIGYNWQSGGAVYGLEADFSGLTGSVSKTLQTDVLHTDSLHSDINWMATFRGRLGLAAGTNTLLYVTGGVALADIRNRLTYSDIFGNDITWTSKKTKSGSVIGFGVEQMFAPNWTARLEGLLASFGRTNVQEATSNRIGVFSTTGSNATEFKNEVVIVRAALNYRF